MIPLRDENPTLNRPITTYIIIGMNAVVWVFVQGFGSTYGLAESFCSYALIPGDLLGIVPANTEIPVAQNLACPLDGNGRLSTLFSSMFMHGGWLHILGNMLFQNSYRVKNSDVYDLGFVFNDKTFIDTRNRINSIMSSSPEKGLELNEVIDLTQVKRLYEGYIPGEEVMIKRMLYDIIERNDYYKHVKPQNILYWTGDEDDPGSTNMNNFAENYVNFYKKDVTFECKLYF